MDIEAIVQKRMGHHYGLGTATEAAIRSALNEAESCMAMEHNYKMLQVEAAHTIELMAYERTVARLEAKVREIEEERVPDGWKRVPTEATSDMVKAGMMVGDVGLYAIYGVMIDAAPKKEGG